MCDSGRIVSVARVYSRGKGLNGEFQSILNFLITKKGSNILKIKYSLYMGGKEWIEEKIMGNYFSFQMIKAYHITFEMFGEIIENPNENITFL